MTVLAEKVRKEALELPANERAEIARFLIQSISPPESFVAENELESILNRRLSELKEGRVKAIPSEIVFERIRQKFL